MYYGSYGILRIIVLRCLWTNVRLLGNPQKDTHKRITSAPYTSMMSLGATVLPTDLDHFATFAVHNEAMSQYGVVWCFTSCCYCSQQGRVEPTAMLVGTFRYIAHGTSKPLTSSTPDQEEPESNHTSMMSVSFLNSS